MPEEDFNIYLHKKAKKRTKHALCTATVTRASVNLISLAGLYENDSSANICYAKMLEKKGVIFMFLSRCCTIILQNDLRESRSGILFFRLMFGV